MDFCNFMQYVSMGSLVASGVIIALGCIILLAACCGVDLDILFDSLVMVGIGAAFVIITLCSKDYYTKVFTERAQNNVAIEKTINTETAEELNTDDNSIEETNEQVKAQTKETFSFLLLLAVAAPFVIIFLFVLFIILLFVAMFSTSTEDIDNAEKKLETKEHSKIKESEEAPDNQALYDRCVSYNCLISEWGKKATEFQDDDFANILYNIAEKLRDLEKYRKRELISNNVVNKVYNIYLQDFKEYQKEYCTYIDVKEEASKEIIKSVKESVVLIQALLTEITQTEIEKDVEMKRTQISASRKSLEAIITQHGYILKNKA